MEQICVLMRLRKGSTTSRQVQTPVEHVDGQEQQREEDPRDAIDLGDRVEAGRAFLPAAPSMDLGLAGGATNLDGAAFGRGHRRREGRTGVVSDDGRR